MPYVFCEDKEKVKQVRRDCREGRIDLKNVLLKEVPEIMKCNNIGEAEAFGQWIDTEAKCRV